MPGAELPELKQRRVPSGPTAERARGRGAARRTASAPTSPPTTRCPTPPFWGSRVVKGIPLKDYASWLDEGALFKGQWGLKEARKGDGPSYEELVETEGRPRLRDWLDRLHTENMLEAAVVYGYFPCVSKGDDLILLDDDGSERDPLHLPAPAPRPAAVPGGLLPPRGVAARGTSSAFRWSPSARGSARTTGELFAANAYRDYLELHGLSVQLAEALAEYWHARVRSELGYRRRGPRRRDGHVRPEVPWRPLLPRLRRLPRPGGPGQDRRAARARAHRGRTSPRSSNSTPSSPPTRSSSTIPRRSTSTRGNAWGDNPHNVVDWSVLSAGRSLPQLGWAAGLVVPQGGVPG